MIGPTAKRSPDFPASLPERVLFLHQSSVFERFGGIESYLDDLEKLTQEVCGTGSVLAMVPWRKKESPPAPNDYPVRFCRLPSHGALAKLSNRFSPALLAGAFSAARECDPTLILCGHVSLAPLAFTLSRLRRIPFAVMAYGFEVWGKLWPQDLFALRQADSIFSISHWTKRILVERGLREDRIEVIQPRLPSEFEEVPYPSTLSSGPLRLLTISRLDPGERYKGQDHVMQAIALLRKESPRTEVRYTIQGEGEDLARLQAIAISLGIADRVVFRPAVKNRKDLAETYRAADVFIMPSRFLFEEGKWRGEGFGIVYLEAAAFGIPSIAYDCGGATDIIRNEVDGLLLPPDDIEALARSIKRLAEDRSKIHSMGKAAHSRIMAEFTRPRIKEQLSKALIKATRERR